MTTTSKTWPAVDLSRPLDVSTAEDVAGLLAAFLDDNAPAAVVDTSVADRLAWRVFFASAEARDAAAAAVAAERRDLRVAPVDVPDEQWAERSQASLRALRIGRLVVAPPWDVDDAAAIVDEADEGGAPATDTVLVVIEPSMGFGTGHHESTRMCLRALQRIDMKGRQVLDLGTGSGVLAIAAAKLGCRRALAVDDDQDAVEAAQLNVARNGVADRVEVRCADLGADGSLRGDLVVGNLTGGLLRRLADVVRHCVMPGGTLVLSGFTEDERASVEHAFLPFSVVAAHTEHGWIALTLRHNS
jgi:ribosomal protein L11 methyltransferase